MSSIQLAKHQLTQGMCPLIIAEVGITANGDLSTALELIHAASEAKADGIKFMMIDPDYFMSDTSITYSYSWAGGTRTENMYDMFRSLMFTPEEWNTIRQACDKVDLPFLLTVDYVPGIALAEQLGVAAYKLSSWDARHFPLITAMVKTKKPVLLDLGPASLAEVFDMQHVFQEHDNHQMILMHCSHAKIPNEMNLMNLPYLGELFNCPIAYSADTRDSMPDLMAVALGTVMLEKRLTLNTEYAAHHHDKALNPQEFNEYVQMIRKAHAMLGQKQIAPSQEDLKQRELYYVSIVAEEDIPAGTVIQPNMLACKRPGHGISPKFLPILYGRKTQRALKYNQLLSWDDV